MTGPGDLRAPGARPALIAFLSAASVVVTPALPAAAEAAPRAVLLHAPGEDALARHTTTLLSAELKAAGFEAVEADRTAGHDIRGDIEATWARLQPVAIFAIRTGADREPTGSSQAADPGATIELWIEDRRAGKIVIRRIDVGTDPGAATDLALKAVELLHGSLLEVTIKANAERSPPPPEVARQTAGAAPYRAAYFARGLSISAGVGALNHTGVGATFAPVVRLGWGGARGLVVRLSASGLGSVPEVKTDEGIARIRQALVLVEGLRVFRQGARLQPFVGAGAGAYHVRGEGAGASTLFPPGAGNTNSAAFAVQAGLAVRLGDRFALVSDASLLLLTPGTRIVIGTREAARAGGLSLLATLTLGAVF